MVNYIEATLAPLKNDGQIKLHGPEAFAGMRKAGRLVAECLDAIDDIVRPGLPTAGHRPTSSTSSPWTMAPCRRRSATRATRKLDLHLDQPRRLPRHPEREAASRRRHRQYRRDADRRRLARRFEPHVQGRRRQARRRAAVDVTYEAMMRGIAAIAARPHHRRHRRRHPGLRRGASAAASSATSAATASAGSSTTCPTSCTTAAPARASCSSRA